MTTILVVKSHSECKMVLLLPLYYFFWYKAEYVEILSVIVITVNLQSGA